jgi:O-antigen/teichoic acid export membrane protein
LRIDRVCGVGTKGGEDLRKQNKNRSREFGHSLKLFPKKGFWALADQGVVSIGNFGCNLLLARHLPAAEYGTFVLMLSAILIANSFHSAIIISPLVVKAAPASEDEQRRYATGSLLFTCVLSVLSVAVLMASALSLGAVRIGIIACLSAVAWQLQESMRRTLIAQRRYSAAIWGDGISYVGQAVAVFAIIHAGFLSVEKAFVALAVTSLLAAFVQALQVRVGTVSLPSLLSNAREFWTLSRWLLPAAVVGTLTTQAFPWILNWTQGRGHAASFQALINVLGITHPVLLSVSALVLPAVAAVKGARRFAEARRIAWSYTWQFEAMVAPYLIVLLIWPGAILRLFYGPLSPFASLTTPLRLMVITYAFAFPLMVWGAALTGVEKVREGFRVQLLGATTTVVIGFPACLFLGVSGAAVGDAVSRAVRTIASYLWLDPRKQQIVETNEFGYSSQFSDQ